MSKNKSYETNLSIFPVRHYDENVKAFVLEDGTYLDIFEKIPEDIDNMMEDEVQYIMMNFAKFLKTYKDDIKILTMNFPPNLSAPIKHLKDKLEVTNDPVRRKYLSLSIDELYRAAKGTKRREYYLIVLSETVESHFEHLKQLKVLGNTVRALSLEKKTKLIYKLCNMNSVILATEE